MKGIQGIFQGIWQGMCQGGDTLKNYFKFSSIIVSVNFSLSFINRIELYKIYTLGCFPLYRKIFKRRIPISLYLTLSVMAPCKRNAVTAKKGASPGKTWAFQPRACDGVPIVVQKRVMVVGGGRKPVSSFRASKICFIFSHQVPKLL